MNLYPYARTPRPPFAEVNYDEAAVPAFSLPDPLLGQDGRELSTPEVWLESRRPELLDAFARYVYGRAPGRGLVAVASRTEETGALAGLAKRIEMEVQVRATDKATTAPLVLHVLIYLPARSRSPSPLFLGLNFFGNHTVHPDSGDSGRHRLVAQQCRARGDGVDTDGGVTRAACLPLACRDAPEPRLRPGHALRGRHRSRL